MYNSAHRNELYYKNHYHFPIFYMNDCTLQTGESLGVFVQSTIRCHMPWCALQSAKQYMSDKYFMKLKILFMWCHSKNINF